jgi:hypothetical protein
MAGRPTVEDPFSATQTFFILCFTGKSVSAWATEMNQKNTHSGSQSRVAEPFSRAKPHCGEPLHDAAPKRVRE